MTYKPFSAPDRHASLILAGQPIVGLRAFRTVANMKRVRSVSDLTTDAITIGHEIITARSKKKKVKVIVASDVSQPTMQTSQPVFSVDSIDEAIDSVLSQNNNNSNQDVSIGGLIQLLCLV